MKRVSHLPSNQFSAQRGKSTIHLATASKVDTENSHEHRKDLSARGSQAVRLSRAFHFAGKEALIEKHGDEVVLKPMPAQKFSTFTEIWNFLAEKFPDSADFPEPPPRPKKHKRPILEL